MHRARARMCADSHWAQGIGLTRPSHLIMICGLVFLFTPRGFSNHKRLLRVFELSSPATLAKTKIHKKVAENRNVNAIFGDLFTKEGNSFAMRPAHLFMDFDGGSGGGSPHICILSCHSFLCFMHGLAAGKS